MDLNELRERLAELEHRQWVEWANGLIATENLSQERVDRWNDIFTCEFKDLPEHFKEKDRLYADCVIELLEDMDIITNG